MIIRFKKFGIDVKQLVYVLLFCYLAIAPMVAVMSLAVILVINGNWLVWALFASSLATMLWWHVTKG